ncbi:hybrid sensor histidine kinase/response regulator [Zemynaea arenosa]|uniref:hybrid sensor histidine kinase/response regulator n=1 Tax=Zemynaea arenosa TaxID=2561931 RepID=UPI001E2CF726|nr:response regulator [Massilia arenosa]
MDAVSPSTESTEILIVEDSPTQAERLRRLIHSQGYQVRVAHNGALALDAIRERMPDLVLSDIVMPEMNGYELCREIKQDAALKAIPVILVTSLTDPQDIFRGIECGADNFIRKPYAEDYLMLRIAHVLRNLQLRRASDDGAGVGLYLGDQQYVINADRQQILDLLVSTYEQAVQVNAELQARERQVIDLNTRLAHHAAELESTNREIALKNVELAEASRMKSAFIANMSHELRTPLNAIIGFTGALLMKLPGPLTGDQEKQLNTIRTSARHLLSLINDILDVAKIEAGKIKIAPERVNLNALVQETVDTLRQMAAHKGLALTVEVPEDAVALDTDRRAFTQIVINLVNNAIKFTERGGVRVTLRREGDGAVLDVADSGTGIRAQDQAKLFKAFSQLDSTSTRHAEGTGLGLYLCQNLANLLGGQIAFASEFGVGSTFSLMLSGETPQAVS